MMADDYNGPITNSSLDLQAQRDIVTAIFNLTSTISGLVTSYAPAAASYLVGSSDATLTAERVVTNTDSVTWDLSVSGQAKANVANSSIVSVTTQFDKTTSTALANIPGLSITVTTARRYGFRAMLYVDADATGGHKYAIAGTATATVVIYQVQSNDNGAPGIFRLTSRQTALAGAAGQAGQTGYFTEINGTITVNAGGTLTVQFAQNASNGTSSVLVGSTFQAWLV